MSSDADLSTDDLARQSGVRNGDVAGDRDEQRAGSTGTGVQESAPAAGGDPRAAREVRGDDAGTVPEFPAVSRDDDVADRDMGAAPDGGSSPAPRAGMPREAAPPGRGDGGGDMALVEPSEGARFRERWNDVQARFVDDPRGAVQNADGLVAELMQLLARGFSDHKGRLESAWQSGDDPDTEELRQALQRYRSFFDRLLST